MKSEFTLSIPTPCNENWNNFTPSQKGKFCAACQKEVIDFTGWTETEIKKFFLHQTQPVCGRMAQHQLKRYAAQPIVRFSLPPLGAALLVLLAQPVQSQTEGKKENQEQLWPARVKAGKPAIKIRGQVTGMDSTELLPGVNVVCKGTTNGTVTNANGQFELELYQAKPIETIQFSFIGMIPVEVEVATQQPSELNVTMHYDALALNETVVVGGICVRRFSPRRIWWRFKSIFR
ncbi:MAG: carboxypeptidase-like regulatory domain-containing protein [Cyclobacteriaceae bacterium]|nr:carboxypeptidase-like regulatory domain-containing protein [Cyclobacteriaceae bacterium]